MAPKYNMFILMFVLTIHLNSQTVISLPSTEISPVSDLWNLEVNNTGGDRIVSFISIELRKQNQLVYQARSNNYSFNNGLNVLQMNMLQPIQVQRDEVGILEGEYNLDIKLIDAQTQQVRFADRLQITGVSEVGNEGLVKEGGVSIFELSGHGAIYTQFSDRQGVGSELPRNHLRAELHPDVSLYGIPVGIEALYSTEQNAFRQSMNQISFRFDAQAYKKQMQSQWQDKVKAIERSGDLSQLNQLKSLKDAALDKKFPKLKDWEAQMADQDIKKGLADLKQYEDLDNVLRSKEIQENLSRYKELSSKKELTDGEQIEMTSLQAFNAEIEKLQAKKATLKGTVDQYKKYSGLQKKIKKAKRYKHLGLEKDADFAKDGLESIGMMNKGQQFLGGIKVLELGTSYPYYSRLSMSSISINGIHVEWNPGSVYIAATYGQSARRTYNTSFVIPELNLSQKTLATKVGYGSPYGNHFHLVFVDIKDDEHNLSLDNPIKPASNRVYGLDAQISILADKVKLGGELMSSLLTRDHSITTNDGNEFDRSDIPMSGLYGNINASSSYDIAWRAYTDVKLFGNNTKVKASMERVGANYYSLGSPTLLNDLLRWKAALRQSFFKHRLSFSAFARQDANNLNPLLTTSNSTLQSYGLSSILNIPKWPSLVFSYAPYSQKSELIGENTTQQSDADILNLTVSYPFSLGKGIRAHTQVNYINQSLSSTIPEIGYGSTLYGINQNLSIKNYGLNLAYTYTPDQVIGDLTQDVSTINITGQITQNKWRTNLGVQVLNTKNVETRTGFYGTVDYQIINNLNLTFRAQRNIYESTLDNDLNGFSDYVINTGLVYNFDYKSKGRKVKSKALNILPANETSPVEEEIIAESKPKEEVQEEIEKEEAKLEKQREAQEEIERQEVELEKQREAQEEIEREDVELDKQREVQEEIEKEEAKLEKQEDQLKEAETQEEELVNDNKIEETDKLVIEKPENRIVMSFKEMVETAQSENLKNHDKIYFAVEDNPDIPFISLMGIGPVNNIKSENGLYLYYIQVFDDEEKAKRIQKQLVRSGHNNATLVNYNNGVKLSTKSAQDLKQEEERLISENEKLKNSACAVIIHSIRDINKANTIAQQIEKDGYVCFQEKNGKFNRVGIKVDCNDSHLNELVNEIKRKYNKDAWLRK